MGDERAGRSVSGSDPLGQHRRGGPAYMISRHIVYRMGGEEPPAWANYGLNGGEGEWENGIGRDRSAPAGIPPDALSHLCERDGRDHARPRQRITRAP
jgi:hypothetical protein